MKTLRLKPQNLSIFLAILQCFLIQFSHAQTLGQALEEPTWSWENYGSSDWVVTYWPGAIGGSCAQAGGLGYSSDADLFTTVTGPGTLTFYYAATGVNLYQLYIDDGSPINLSTYQPSFTSYSVSIPSGMHYLDWYCEFSGSASALLDYVSFTPSGTVAPTINTSSPLPSGAVGTAYSQTLYASGGVTPYTWSITSGGLPAGLSMSSGGVISGTPSLVTNVSFTAQVRGGNGASSNKVFSLTIFPAQPTITSTSPLPTGMAGMAYTNVLSVSGSIAPYTWSIVAGGLPAGLAVDGGGIISGTPLEATNSNFTVQVTGNNGFSTNKAFTLAIVAADVVYGFTNFVGLPGTSNYIDGTGSMARFYLPQGLTVDKTNNLFVADWMNWAIRKITPAGVVSTLANVSSYPSGVAADSAGNVFVVKHWAYTIDKISPLGAVTTIVGSNNVSGSADGTNGNARFNAPTSIAADNAGNLYVADTYNSTIRKITPVGTNWVVTTLAGNPGVTGSIDGTNNGARFNYPQGVAVDNSGNVFVADTSNYTIRKLTPVETNWVVTTLAGSAGHQGFADGAGVGMAQFLRPLGLTVDNAGNVFVTDANSIRKISAASIVTTIGGYAYSWGTNDGIGIVARFGVNYMDAGTVGVAVDNVGNVFVTDSGNHRISKGVPINRPTITTPSPLPLGIVGTAYRQTLRASGSTMPYSWSIVSGNLPPGLALSNDGTISGTPSAMVTNNFIVQVAGANGLVSTNSFSMRTVIRGSLSVQSNSVSGFQLNITGVLGGLYIVQVSTNLIVWTSLQTNYAPFIFTDTNSGSYPNRFYRSLYLQQ